MFARQYLDVVYYYRWLVFAVITGMTLGAFLLSLLFLHQMPVYTGVAKVSMLPTETELVFTRGWVQGSQLTPANMMTQTHMEYLVSRPVVETTIKRLGERFSGAIAQTPQLPQTDLAVAVTDMKAKLRQLYNIINSGKHVLLDPREALIRDLADSISVKMVEGSYILEISVSWGDPDIAAAATDLLAEAYVDRVREQTVSASEAIAEYLRREIDGRERRLGQLRSAGLKLGLLDLRQERDAWILARESERTKFSDDEAQLISFARRTEALRASRDQTERQGVATLIDEELALEEPKRRELESRVAFRRQTIAEIDMTLQQLAGKENELESLEEQISQGERDLSSLRDRLTTTELSQSSSLANLRIIDPAVVPIYPSSPKVVKFTFVGFAAGVALAAFLIVALDTISNTVKTASDLRRVVSERSLGTIKHAVSRAARGGSRSLWNRFRRARLARINKEIATVLHALGTGRQVIRVASLGPDTLALDAAAVLTVALQDQGSRVRLEAGPDLLQKLSSSRKKPRFMSSVPDASCSTTFEERVICLGSFSKIVNWPRLAAETSSLVIAMKAGTVTESRLKGIVDHAREQGVENVFGMVLTD